MGVTMNPSAAARLREVIAERDRYREALQLIADGRWNVGREQQSVDVRTFARMALASEHQRAHEDDKEGGR